jgi:hypothetical protein
MISSQLRLGDAVISTRQRFQELYNYPEDLPWYIQGGAEKRENLK